MHSLFTDKLQVDGAAVVQILDNIPGDDND